MGCSAVVERPPTGPGSVHDGSRGNNVADPRAPESHVSAHDGLSGIVAVDTHAAESLLPMPVRGGPGDSVLADTDDADANCRSAAAELTPTGPGSVHDGSRGSSVADPRAPESHVSAHDGLSGIAAVDTHVAESPVLRSVRGDLGGSALADTHDADANYSGAVKWEYQSDDDSWSQYNVEAEFWMELCWNHELEHCTVMLMNGEQRTFYRITFATLIQRNLASERMRNVRRQGQLLPAASLGEWWPNWTVKTEDGSWLPFGRAVSGQIEVAVSQGALTCAISVLVEGKPIPYIIDLARSIQINPQTNRERAVRRWSLDEEIAALPDQEAALADIAGWTQEAASIGLQRTIDDYHSRKQGSTLGVILQEGAMALAKGDYFITRCRQGLCMQRRQDVCTANMWDPQSFVQKWNAQGGHCITFVAVSYSWICRGNPDPERYHLQRLASIAAALKAASIGVFLDFVSLYQLPRSVEEQCLFKKALAIMDVIYGHYFVTVVVLRGLPASVQLRAEERGWPFFEKTVATLNEKSLISGKIFEFDETFVPTENLDLTTDEGERIHSAKQNPPCNPSEFALGLQARVFTNGRAERETVCAMYKAVFICQFGTILTNFAVNALGKGINYEWIRSLLRCLPYLAAHRRIQLRLGHNPAIGDKGAICLRRALLANPALAMRVREIYLNDCNVSAENIDVLNACGVE